MKIFLRMGTAVLLGSALLGGAVFAQNMEERRRMIYRELLKEVDKDGDRKLSKAEFLAIWKDRETGEKNYVHFDRNKDGFITEEEYVKSTGMPGKQRNP